MADNNQKRSIPYLLLTAAIIILVLVAFPTVEEYFRLWFIDQFNLILTPEGAITSPPGEAQGKMSETVLKVILTIMTIVKVILLMALVVTVIRIITALVTRTIYRNATQGEISSLLKTVVTVIIYIVAFFVIFQSQFPDVQLAPLFTGSTIIGIVVGLALQDTLGNLFAGLALQADQPFVVGDVIMIGTRSSGVVESVSWRGVKIRTFQNQLVVISNSVLGKETIEVAPKNNLNARNVFFTTLTSHSPAKTIQVIRRAVQQVPNVSAKIRPVVRIRNLGESGLEWEVKYWLDDYNAHNDTDADIRQRIWYVFHREGIEFAYPTRTIHLQQRPDEIAPEEVINTMVERLHNVSIFAPLSDDEIERLAAAATARVYAPGEAIVRIGQEGNSMFVIIRGSVRVQVPGKVDQKVVNDLGENDFFGEMSLLTGEPRSANVVAIEETEVLQIKSEGFRPILESNPALVESICELIDERKVMLAETENQIEEENERRKGVMRSIRKFFGLRGSA